MQTPKDLVQLSTPWIHLVSEIFTIPVLVRMCTIWKFPHKGERVCSGVQQRLANEAQLLPANGGATPSRAALQRSHTGDPRAGKGWRVPEIGKSVAANALLLCPSARIFRRKCP